MNEINLMNEINSLKKQIEAKDNLIKLKDEMVKSLENSLKLKDETIENDCCAAYGHGQYRRDWMKLSQESGKEFQGIEHPCRNRDEHSIIEKGPEQILSDRSHGSPAELNRLGDPGQVSAS